MNTQSLRIEIYKILRYTGIKRERIIPYMSFFDDLKFDDFDWNLFLYKIESRFNISVDENELLQLATIENTINYVYKRINA